MSGLDDRLEALRRARGARLDAARPDIVTRIHGNGRLTARERLDLLMDPGSEVPYGTIAAADPESDDNPWVTESGGLDALCSIDGHAAVVSTTDYSDSGGGYGAARIGRLLALAREHRWPVVAFVDGGGSRARHPRAGLGHVELSGAFGPYTIFDGMAELSGWVPTISIVSGPSFAGHASIAGFSDVVIATAGSAIGMGGPPMVEAALGKRLTPRELSSAEMQLANGGIELLVEDERAAVAVAKRCLAYWHDESVDEVPVAATWRNPVPEEGPYDMTDLIEGLVDPGSFLELRAPFAPSVQVGFARLGGRSVGVLSTNPMHDGGRIDELGAQKISRHVELCDAWQLPIVALIDTLGTSTRWIARDRSVSVEEGQSRMHMRCILAHQSRQVPLLAVQVRHGRGLAPALLTGYSTGASVPAVVLGWHSVELNRADGYALVRDANAFDDIIEPEQTRERLVRVLRLLPRDRGRSEKHRAVDSW
ncbi:MAG: carboxyl transferase domain-containing protein [Pseudomonadales bacterium]|jgi:acetyl-CoA carboxylase carboxyltransferase component